MLRRNLLTAVGTKTQPNLVKPSQTGKSLFHAMAWAQYMTKQIQGQL